ncbi:MAG: exo-alpha-sialidase [bacterium]|nr:exo-alpha-sialidase [bacterium]
MNKRLLLPLILLSAPAALAETPPDAVREPAVVHLEVPDDPYVAVPIESRVTGPAFRAVRGAFASVQVNVDGAGMNIVGDAANEPSIAVDLTGSQRVAIGWRQFDTITSSFRQAGWGQTADGGATWTTGTIEPGVFRSDPVLDSDAAGNFYYNSLSVPGTFQCDVFRSADGGATWDSGVYALGGDKQWMAIDRGAGVGAGNVYSNWSESASCCADTSFTRSTDGGDSYENAGSMPQQPRFGTTAVAPSGNVYVAGAGGFGNTIYVVKSTTLQDPGLAPAFDSAVAVDLGGSPGLGGGPNPGGLSGQVWVATSQAPGLAQDEVYVLASVDPPGTDPLDVHFVRSTDGGATWSTPVRVNDDAGDAWQWFGTMSVAPGGRIDVVWNDSRSDPGGFDSALYYSFSTDGGVSWSSDVPLSPSFDPHLGWPQQDKIGDYYDMVSEDDVVHVAWAATFNGEQDVYYLRLEVPGLFTDGFESGDTGAWSGSTP